LLLAIMAVFIFAGDASCERFIFAWFEKHLIK